VSQLEVEIDRSLAQPPTTAKRGGDSLSRFPALHEAIEALQRSPEVCLCKLTIVVRGAQDADVEVRAIPGADPHAAALQGDPQGVADVRDHGLARRRRQRQDASRT